MSKSITQTKNNEQENETRTTLIGWARRSRAGGALKLSLHTEAVTNCHSYTTADDTAYVPLLISIAALAEYSMVIKQSLRLASSKKTESEQNCLSHGADAIVSCGSREGTLP